MYVLFLCGCLIFGIITMLFVFIGHKLYMKMYRDEEKFDIEKEAYESIKDEIKGRKKS